LLEKGVNHQATHNAQGQKALQNRHGIFVSYNPQEEADADPETTSTWVLARSQDGGKTFRRIFSTSMHRIMPPSIQSDEAGNVYAIHGTGTEWLGGLFDKHPKDAWFYKFEAAKGFKGPKILKIPNASTGKSDFIYDGKVKRFYYMTFNDTFPPIQSIPAFFVLTRDGSIEYQTPIGQNLDPIEEKYAKIMYPHLRSDGKRVIAAWSTEYDPPGADASGDTKRTNLYRNISFMWSGNAGRSWKNLAGSPITLPLRADDAGPATLVTSPDELGDHNWLGGIAYANGKLFLAHQVWGVAHPGVHAHLSVFDLEKKVRSVDARGWAGSALDPDGTGKFIVGPASPDGPIYYAAGGAFEGKPVLVILRSGDHGRSWTDYAVGGYAAGDPAIVSNVVVSPSVTPDGHIIGIYTRCAPRPELGGRCESHMNGKYTLDSSVYFFRVKAE